MVAAALLPALPSRPSKNAPGRLTVQALPTHTKCKRTQKSKKKVLTGGKKYYKLISGFQRNVEEPDAG
jgi:hypothetical protein